ncbi:putative lipid II flippase FtsW [Magnetospirillum molischianum]|uniref:Probable peptidoglycan glycosyltransferase FtsW n=1 Tax=Magnetospirillum molischianum DSM 120 TaxID=1150626 RepID=H8FMQ6_MAGML|nr:putative lipid II flippase FtsW [Magnetospirillum molischianum]CCG39644.1 essential cell division protein (stabilizes FtsZ ring) [Magnetospirillum molischianum DSM 120]
MSVTFGRTDTSVLGRWWWTVDRWTIAALLLLIAVGALLTMAASPAVAERIGAQSFHFVRRQFVFLAPAVILMLGISLLTPKQIRRTAVIGLLISLLLLALVPLLGAEVKGARRWLSLGGLSVQPSEFVKPFFTVVAGWMFASARLEPGFPGRIIATGLFGLTALLLLVQPDVGQTVILASIWAVQFFLAGLPLIWLAVLGMAAPVGAVVAYQFFPHVQSRVDRFLDPSAGDAYQVTTALSAFRNGGLFGRGPGEGKVKLVLPDAHTDFILAVGGEEFGLLLCLLVVALFAFIVLRGLSRLVKEDNLFVVLATAGLLVQFGMQAIINMASTLRLMPAKGMTLPFISYGGSSMLALALGMGMVLALTRTRYGREGLDA